MFKRTYKLMLLKNPFGSHLPFKIIKFCGGKDVGHEIHPLNRL